MAMLPPIDPSTKPDKETAAALKNDFTAPSADNRVLYVNLGLIKYGTHDRTHAASMILSAALFLLTMYVIFTGLSNPDNKWVDKVFTWVTSSFLFVAGIALGKGGSEKGTKSEGG